MYFDSNRQVWNERTRVHVQSKFYDVAAFKEGKLSLTPLELEEMQDEVTGKSLLHLQCHFGLDTLSWARLGAHATGIDLSDVAIAEAQKLNQELGLDARFVCANVYELPAHLQGQFDVVYTSFGVVGWLPDLDRWAAVIAHFLKPGGVFYLAEFHPVVWMFDDNFQYVQYAYHNTHQPIITQNQGTYTDRSAPIAGTEYSWNHGLAEVINALLSQGLQLEFLHEFPYSPYNCFNNTEQSPDGNWRIKNMADKIPMVYSLKARKMASHSAPDKQ